MERWWRGERGRKRLAEIGDIVLGVLIALALGALASEIGWMIEASKARDALAVELGEIVGQGRERETADVCVERRLDTVAGILDEADRSGRLPPVGPIGSPMFRTWSTGVWTSTISADIASHMDRDELDDLSGVYEFVGITRTETQNELNAWTRLYAIVGPGRAITSAEIVELRNAITQARLAHRAILIGSIGIERTADESGLQYDPNTTQEYSAMRPLSRALCGPIEPPNGRPYGQAPFPNAARSLRAPVNPTR